MSKFIDLFTGCTWGFCERLFGWNRGLDPEEANEVPLRVIILSPAGKKGPATGRAGHPNRNKFDF